MDILGSIQSIDNNVQAPAWAVLLGAEKKLLASFEAAMSIDHVFDTAALTLGLMLRTEIEGCPPLTMDTRSGMLQPSGPIRT